MSYILLIFLNLIFFLSASAQVENFGEKGWLGNNDVVDRLEAYMGNASKCKKATRSEMYSIDDCLPNYALVERQNLKDFDNLSEELIFMEAARKTHQLGMCQVKLHKEILNNKKVRDQLFTSAFKEFQYIKQSKNAEINDFEQKGKSLSAAKSASIGFADDMKAGVADDMARRRMKAQKEFKASEQKIFDLVARVPMGNRPIMRTHLINLLRSKQPLTEASFLQVYTKAVRELRAEAARAEAFFKKNSFPDPTNKDGMLYTVNEDLKKSLVRSGQVTNVLRTLGMEEKLADSFMCRAKARYVEGPHKLTMAEIPFYFLGVYGLGRLGIRATIAGVQTTKKIASGAAAATRFTSQMALVGLHSYEWARVADGVREACIPQEFLTTNWDDGCTADSEVSGIYQEAMSAQCITNAVLAVGPHIGVAGVTRMVARSGKVEVAAAKEAKAADEEIVVVAKRPTLIVHGRKINPKDFSDVKEAVGKKLDNPAIRQHALDELSAIRNLPLKTREREVAKLIARIQKWDSPLNATTRLTAKHRLKRFERDVTTLKAKYAKEDPKADKHELASRAEKDAFAKRERTLELRKMCTAKTPNPNMDKATMRFTNYSVGISVLSTLGTYSYKHWDDVKDTKYAQRLGYEVAMAYISARISSKLFTAQTTNGLQKYVSSNVSGFAVNSAEALLYNSLFADDSEKAKANWEKIKNSPTFKEDLKELDAYLEKQKEIDQFANEMRDFSSTVVSAITGKDADNITAEELQNLDYEQLKDPIVQERVIEALADKVYSDESGPLKTGSKGTDRLAFNTIYSAPMSAAGVFVQYLALQTLCRNIDQPKKAFGMFVGIQVAQRLGFGAIYYGERKQWINQ